MANFQGMMKSDKNKSVPVYRHSFNKMITELNSYDVGVRAEGETTKEGPVIKIYETGGSMNTLEKEEKLIKTIKLE